MSIKWQNIEREAQKKAHSNEVSELNTTIKRYQQTVEELQAQLGIALSLAKTRKQAAGVIPLTNGAASATAFAICSDWHVEENVTAASVNGLNEFNLKIAEQRIDKLTASILRLV